MCLGVLMNIWCIDLSQYHEIPKNCNHNIIWPNNYSLIRIIMYMDFKTIYNTVSR